VFNSLKKKNPKNKTQDLISVMHVCAGAQTSGGPVHPLPHVLCLYPHVLCLTLVLSHSLRGWLHRESPEEAELYKTCAVENVNDVALL